MAGRSLIGARNYDKLQTLRAKIARREPSYPIAAPMIPVVQSGFGRSDSISILFCGMAGGHTGDLRKPSFNTRKEQLLGQLEDQLARPSSSFWREIVAVRRALIDAGHSTRIGWANICPLHRSDTPNASRRLARLQTDASRHLWTALFRRSRADVIVCTFAQTWFDLHDAPGMGYSSPQWGWQDKGKIAVRHAATTEEPTVLWVDHVGRRASRADRLASIILKLTTRPPMRA